MQLLYLAVRLLLSVGTCDSEDDLTLRLFLLSGTCDSEEDLAMRLLLCCGYARLRRRLGYVTVVVCFGAPLDYVFVVDCFGTRDSEEDSL